MNDRGQSERRGSSAARNVCWVLVAALLGVATVTVAQTRPAKKPRPGEVGGPARWLAGPPRFAEAKRFAVALDVSQPAGRTTPSPVFDHLKLMLEALKPEQSFAVRMAAATGPVAVGAPKWAAATPANVAPALKQLSAAKLSQRPGAPIETLRLLLAQRPDAMFLLVDHEWSDPRAVAEQVLDMLVPHESLQFVVVALQLRGEPPMSETMRKELERIGNFNGGGVRYMKEENLEPTTMPATRAATRPVGR